MISVNSLNIIFSDGGSQGLQKKKKEKKVTASQKDHKRKKPEDNHLKLKECSDLPLMKTMNSWDEKANKEKLLELTSVKAERILTG